MQTDDSARRRRVATARQRTGVALLLIVLFALVWAARSGRYDHEIGRLSRGLEAAVHHLTGALRRHGGG